MAGPTRISQLTDGSPVQPTDQVPVARGSGVSGYTYKVNAGRIVSDLFNVSNTPTVDLTFDASTRTLSADVSTAVKNASAFNVVDSPTIDLTWNSSTRTLSADAGYLLSLINTLSTNMQNIGNYPYLEYAWVTAPNAAGQSITANTITTLTLNTEVADTGNFGSVSGNQITLAAGTYQFHTDISISTIDGSIVQCDLYDITNQRYLGRSTVFSDTISMVYTTGQFSSWRTYQSVNPKLASQFTLNSQAIIQLRATTSNDSVAYGTIATGHAFSSVTANQNQRTTIKLWKVG